jgi:hypothetical protein
MLKGFTDNNSQGMKDWWRRKAHSLWRKISCGAEQRAQSMHFAHGEGWRRKDKFQKNHDSHPHNHHKQH